MCGSISGPPLVQGLDSVVRASNIISKRITDLATDAISRNIHAANKFIVNGKYNNNVLDCSKDRE